MVTLLVEWKNSGGRYPSMNLSFETGIIPLLTFSKRCWVGHDCLTNRISKISFDIFFRSKKCLFFFFFKFGYLTKQLKSSTYSLFNKLGSSFSTLCSWLIVGNRSHKIYTMLVKNIVFCYINLSNLLWTKGFDTINFPFMRNNRVWKMRFESRFCYQGEAEVVNPAWDSRYL